MNPAAESTNEDAEGIDAWTEYLIETGRIYQ